MNLKENIADFIDMKRKTSLLENDNWANLAIIQIGNDPASESYIMSKIKEAAKWNIKCSINHICNPDVDTINDVINLITYLNYDINTNGIIVQLPTPYSKEDTQRILDAIAPEKNVDGFAQTHSGEFAYFYPGTPLGIIEFLKWNYKQATNGIFYTRNVVVIGRGKTVGEPLIKMLLNEPYSSLTVCASNTDPEKLKRDILPHADIVISAVPIPLFVEPNCLKPGVIFVDAGMSMVMKNDKLCQIGNLSHDGICDLEKINNNYINYTPWTNGVGKLTVAMLMLNVRKAYIYQKKGLYNASKNNN